MLFSFLDFDNCDIYFVADLITSSDFVQKTSLNVCIVFTIQYLHVMKLHLIHNCNVFNIPFLQRHLIFPVNITPRFFHDMSLSPEVINHPVKCSHFSEKRKQMSVLLPLQGHLFLFSKYIHKKPITVKPINIIKRLSQDSSDSRFLNANSTTP